MRQRGNVLLIVLIIAGILGLVGFMILRGSESGKSRITSQDFVTGDAAVEVTGGDPGETTDSRYIEYTPEGYEIHKDKRRVLYFYANWCPICRPVDAALRSNTDQIPQDVVILRVNYNDSDTDTYEMELAEKYGITYQHTFVVIDSSGDEVTKWNGGGIDELLDRL